jgi:hypothetical protein
MRLGRCSRTSVVCFVISVKDQSIASSTEFRSLRYAESAVPRTYISGVNNFHLQRCTIRQNRESLVRITYTVLRATMDRTSWQNRFYRLGTCPEIKSYRTVEFFHFFNFPIRLYTYVLQIVLPFRSSSFFFLTWQFVSTGTFVGRN